MGRRNERRAPGLAWLAILFTVAGCSLPPRVGTGAAPPLGAFFAQDLETPGPESPPPRAEQKDESTRVRVDAFYSRLQFNRLESEIIDVSGRKIGTEKLRDTETVRAGARVSFGTYVRGYVQLFGERFLDDTYRGFGIGAGASGYPVLAKLGKNLDLIMPIDGATNVVAGTGEVPVFDRFGTPIGEADQYLVYLNTELTVGLGVDLHGLKPSIGFAYASHFGTFAVEDEIQGYSIDIEGEFTGLNVGGYAGLLYRHPEFPVYAEARYYLGLIEGFFLSAGFTF